jgi:hypothetical protein
VIIDNFLVACSKLLDHVIAYELGEAFAIRSAVTLALEEGLDKISLVSNCLTVIQRNQSPARDRSLVGVVVLRPSQRCCLHSHFDMLIVVVIIQHTRWFGELNILLVVYFGFFCSGLHL